MALLSVRAYAKQRGVSHPLVLRAIKEGRLSRSITKSEGGIHIIDSEVADQEWPRGPRESMTGDEIDDSSRKGSSDPDSRTSQTYAQSRAVREAYQAKLAKLEFDHKSGKLIDAAEVKKSAFDAARMVRNSMMNIPDRLAAELAAETDVFKVTQKLKNEIRKALEGLQVENEVE